MCFLIWTLFRIMHLIFHKIMNAMSSLFSKLTRHHKDVTYFEIRTPYKPSYFQEHPNFFIYLLFQWQKPEIDIQLTSF